MWFFYGFSARCSVIYATPRHASRPSAPIPNTPHRMLESRLLTLECRRRRRCAAPTVSGTRGESVRILSHCYAETPYADEENMRSRKRICEYTPTRFNCTSRVHNTQIRTREPTTPAGGGTPHKHNRKRGEEGMMAMANGVWRGDVAPSTTLETTATATDYY